MKLTVKGLNFTVTPSLRQYVDDKLILQVKKLLEGHSAYQAATLEVELVYGGRHHKKGDIWEAMVNLQLPQKHLWHKVSSSDIHTAIDDLENILKQELKKYKERLRSRLLRGARRAKKELHLSRSARLFRKGRIREEGA